MPIVQILHIKFGCDWPRLEMISEEMFEYYIYTHLDYLKLRADEPMGSCNLDLYTLVPTSYRRFI